MDFDEIRNRVVKALPFIRRQNIDVYNGTIYIRLSDGDSLTMADLDALSKEFGTTNINMTYGEERWYSGDTGGDPSSCEIAVRDWS